MKHVGLQEYLASYLAQAGLTQSSDRLALLGRHIELVIEANRRVNLTRIADPLDAARLHTADSLTVLQDIEAAPDGPLLDLGSGAGFPGIPLAICSNRRVVLLDSVGKKGRELQAMIVALGLEDRVSARLGRAETLALVERGRFAVVTARAVSELPALVELASPLLSEEGRLICLKGSPSLDEMDRADHVADLAGLEREYQRSFDLPEQAGHRTVVCYRKTSESRVSLPRREGLAQHAPLA